MILGQYKFDPYRNRLLDGSREIEISPLAARFLELLARTPGEVVPRDLIITELWHGDFLTGDPGLHRVVSELRRAVGENKSHPKLVQTIHRRGYRLMGNLDAHSDPAKDARGPQARYKLRLVLLVTLAILSALVAFKLISDEIMALQGVGAFN